MKTRSFARRGLFARTARALAWSLVLLTCACGDDSDAQGGEEPVDLDIDPDDWEVFHFSELTPPYEAPEACEEHQPEGTDTKPEVRACLCTECFELQQECDALPGCVEIRACVAESRCRDAYSCYLLPLAPCTEVVDRWGNASVATTVSLQVIECSTDHNCL